MNENHISRFFERNQLKPQFKYQKLLNTDNYKMVSSILKSKKLTCSSYYTGRLYIDRVQLNSFCLFLP